MTRRQFSTGRRDANEKTITPVIERYHVPFVLQPPLAGFDVLVLLPTVELWEIKDSAQKWKLTAAEIERRNYCESQGIVYRVIETVDQAVDALSAALSQERKP